MRVILVFANTVKGWPINPLFYVPHIFCVIHYPPINWIFVTYLDNKMTFFFVRATQLLFMILKNLICQTLLLSLFLQRSYKVWDSGLIIQCKKPTIPPKMCTIGYNQKFEHFGVCSSQIIWHAYVYMVSKYTPWIESNLDTEDGVQDTNFGRELVM